MNTLLTPEQEAKLTTEDKSALRAIFEVGDQARMLSEMGLMDMDPMDYFKMIIDKTKNPAVSMPADVRGTTLSYWAARIAAHSARRHFN